MSHVARPCEVWPIGATRAGDGLLVKSSSPATDAATPEDASNPGLALQAADRLDIDSRQRVIGRLFSQSPQRRLVTFRCHVVQIENDTCKRLDRTGCLVIVDDGLELRIIGICRHMLNVDQRLGDGFLIRAR